MIKEFIKVVDEDMIKFFNYFYKTYGPEFFLMPAICFFIIGLTPGVAYINGSPFPSWPWFIFSGAYLVMYLDMKRRERKKHM